MPEAIVVGHNVALQKGVGVETSTIGPEELREIDPALLTDGVALAAYEPRGGYADPTATTVGFLTAPGSVEQALCGGG